MNNREWLYSLDVADLSDWFDAEQVDDNDDLPQENDISACGVDANDANSEQDSREKLEADTREQLEAEVKFAATVSEDDAKGEKLFTDMVFNWLDRQAAITRLECLYQFEENHRYHIRTLEGANQELNDRIVELQSELDNRGENQVALLEALNEAHVSAFITSDCAWHVENKFQAECDYWKDQVKQSLECACHPDGYAKDVMRYPRPDGFTEPSLLVNDVMNCLRDFYADSQRLVDRLKSEISGLRGDADALSAEIERWRSVYGELCDATHEIQRIIAKLDAS